MKNLIKLSFSFIVFAVIFSSCKKDAVDLENSYMDIIVSEDGLWAGDNNLRYVAYLEPGSISGETVTIKYSSEADPEGYSFEAAYYNTTLESGRDVYNIQKIDRYFEVATETIADDGILKVNPDGDNVTITIGNNIFSETVEFEKKHDPLLVADIGTHGGDYMTGDIIYYNETAERPGIKLYSDSDDTKVHAVPDSDLWDNGYYAADPSVNNYFGRTHYPITIVFDPAEAPGFKNEVKINEESDIIYVDIEGKTYSIKFEGEALYKEIMDKEN